MSEKLTIKYFPENEFSKKPFRASVDAAGYHVIASEVRTILPKTNACIRLDFKMAIAKGFYGKSFPHSGLFRRHLVTCDAGVTDADYRGSVEVLVMNHHPREVHTVRTGDRIGQIIFMKKYDVTFEKVSDPALLGRTKRGSSGFGSTGSSDNKIFVSTVKDQVIIESASMSVNDKVIIDSDISNIDKTIIDSDLSESKSDDPEEINYFFCILQMNNKMISLLLLFYISETFFIALTSFVCGYCVGYYFYELVRPRRRAEEEITKIFLSYNRKYGFVNQSSRKNESK